MDIEKKIELTNLQAKILEVLQIGHENAIGKSDLQKRIGVDERKLREIIESLRLEGYLILIGKREPYGYFMARTQDEVNDCIDYFRSRVKNEYHTYKSLRIAAKKKFAHEFGQIRMFTLNN